MCSVDTSVEVSGAYGWHGKVPGKRMESAQVRVKAIAQGSAKLAERRRRDLSGGPYYLLPRSVKGK